MMFRNTLPKNVLRLALALSLGALPALAGCTDGGVEPVDPAAGAVALEISARTHVLVPGDTATFTAAVTGVSGQPVPNAQVAWSTSDAGVARVDAAGLVTAVATGSALITATTGPVSDTLRVKVEPPLNFLMTDRHSALLAPGATVRLGALTFGQGGIIPLTTHTVVFRSSDPGVVTVSDSGVVRGVAVGSATVTVAAGGKRVDVPVGVVRPYTLTYLGTLGGSSSEAFAVNASGQVVGRAQTADGSTRAFLWENGQMRDLGSASRPYSEAVAINDRGVVVGNAGNAGFGSCGSDSCGSQPWKWENGTLTPIAIDPAKGPAYFTDVNNRGEIAGFTFQGFGRFVSGEGFVWRDGQVTWIGMAGTGYDGMPVRASAVSAINDEGVVAATMTYYAGDRRAYVWRNGQLTLAQPSRAMTSTAGDINLRGQIAGGFYDPNVFPQLGAFVWEAGATRDILLTRGTAYVGVGRGINALGHAVGSVATDATNSYGWVWRDGSVGDLNHLTAAGDWTIVAATGINDRGQIVGFGRHRTTGAVGALLLTPAP